MITAHIEKKDGVYYVTSVPNCLGKLFGKRKRIERFKDTGETYLYGGGHVYRRSDGKELRNGHRIGRALDRWKHSF